MDEDVNNVFNTSSEGWVVIYDEIYGYRAIDLQYLRDNDYTAGEAADAYLDDELFDLGVDCLVSPTGNDDEFVDDFD
ncbi:MAG: hypothetical protein QNJ65_14545 [Xenococcaceae cyanobacterium MO_234.B1]|nr:hypothetical protein [Xenococcaceae cyanobacterium MO_234.B1]